MLVPSLRYSSWQASMNTESFLQNLPSALIECYSVAFAQSLIHTYVCTYVSMYAHICFLSALSSHCCHRRSWVDWVDVKGFKTIGIYIYSFRVLQDALESQRVFLPCKYNTLRCLKKNVALSTKTKCFYSEKITSKYEVLCIESSYLKIPWL